MRYVYQVYKDGSFSRAAEHLYLTQPALSIAIRRIEEGIGTPLFDRSRHPLKLTPAGEAYIRAVERMLLLEEDLDCQIRDLQDLNTGTLHIGGTHYLNTYILAGTLVDFSRRYPGVNIRLLESDSRSLVQALKKRQIDLTFSCAEDDLKEFEHYPVFRDHILLAVPSDHTHSPDHAYSSGKIRSSGSVLPAEVKQAALTAGDVMAGRHLTEECPKLPLACFKDVEFMLLDKGNNLYDRGLRMFEDAGFKPKIKMTLAQLVTAYRLADNGMGATLVSDRLVRSPYSSLEFYKIDSEMTMRQFYLLLPDRDYTSHAIRAFVKHVTATSGTLPGIGSHMI